jgi:ATP-binding cassette, subfamily B, bacterial MsbA
MRRFRPYFKYLRPVRGTLFAAIFYAVLFALTNGISLPTLIKYVFPIIFDRTNDLPISVVIRIAACIPLAFLLRALSGYLNSYYIQLSGVKILEAIRIDYFRKLQFLPLSFVQDKASGDLISRGMSDTGQLQNTLTTLASDGIKQPVQLLATIGTLIAFAFRDQGVWLVLASIALVPLAVLPVRYVGKKIVKRAYQLQSNLGLVTTRFSENLSAAREVRAFGLEERETRRFAAASRDLITSQIKIAKYAQALTPAIEVIAASGIAVTLVFAFRYGIEESTFIAIVTALYFSYEPIKKLGALNNEYKRGLAALDRLEFVLNEPVTITDPAKPIEIQRLRGDIAFGQVTFAYHGTDYVLRNVSASIPAGTVCALVGPSGAGKTTFANLVPRFYEVGSGRVTVDGHDVRELRLADLRQNIAVVSQDPVLFNDTIFNNLMLGRHGATPAEVEQAARDAYAHDFIKGLPQGYETIVGERGVLLSGGQKQRVAIARAFLRNAPILILDEATSALDSDSEAAIQAALKKLVVGKTVLIIAHRFSTIRDATKILVFDRGELVATGNHGELYANNALYRSLYDRQQATPVLAR